MSHGSKRFLDKAKKQLAREASEARARDGTALRPRAHPVPFTEQDVFTAWEVLSPSGRSVLTKSQVLDNLRILFPNIGARDVKDLVGSGNMSVDKLKSLLFKGDMPKFDANAEAFKMIDPLGSGYIDVGVIKHLLQQLPGVDTIDEADLKVILELADTDKDGRISLEDFSAIGSWELGKEMPSPAVKKLMAQREAKEREVKG